MGAEEKRMGAVEVRPEAQELNQVRMHISGLVQHQHSRGGAEADACFWLALGILGIGVQSGGMHHRCGSSGRALAVYCSL